MTQQEVQNFYSFYTTIKEKVLPPKTAYRFAAIADYYRMDDTFLKEQTAAYVNDAAEKDENGNPIPVGDGVVKMRDGAQEELIARLQELYEQKAKELPERLLLEANDIEAIGDVTPSQMLGLIPFIK